MMIARLRQKLTYSNVIASLALFIALGGVAVAAGLAKNSVGTKQLKKNAVTAAKIKKGSVNSAKIAHGAVVAGKIAGNSVSSGVLQNGSVIAAKLAKSSVTNSAIANGVVGTNKLGNAVVNTSKLADKSVTTAKLVDGSVTAAKLGNEVGPLLGTLKSGQTLRGSFDVGGKTEVARAGETFQFPLTNPPTAPETNILEASASNAACPGLKGGNGQTPEASPGQLCVYVKVKEGIGAALSFDVASVNRLGFGLSATFTSAEAKNQVQGFWAVTAP
jgi:hypothetical protein